MEQLKLPKLDDAMEVETSLPGSVFDYSQLNRSYLQDMRLAEREKLEMDFKQRMDALVAEIERTAPNLKALDQYEALQIKEKEVTEKFEAFRKEEKDASDKYNAVRQRRYVQSSDHSCLAFIPARYLLMSTFQSFNVLFYSSSALRSTSNCIKIYSHWLCSSNTIIHYHDLLIFSSKIYSFSCGIFFIAMM